MPSVPRPAEFQSGEAGLAICYKVLPCIVSVGDNRIGLWSCRLTKSTVLLLYLITYLKDCIKIFVSIKKAAMFVFSS